jgi:hypothetical protein
MEKNMETTVTSGMRQSEKLKLIIDFLLNKDQALKWHYFEIELHEHDNTKTVTDRLFEADVLDIILQDIGHWGAPHSLQDGGKTEYKSSSALRRKVNVRTIFSLLLNFVNGNPGIVKEVSKQIFKMGEIPNKSDADQGLIGRFNEKDRAFRNAVFREKIEKEGRNGKKLILAEGDSWFQFPRIFMNVDAVSDVIDHLIKTSDYIVYSLAYGGDWLSNILSLDEYIEELPKLSPDAFLISGGGNDMVGNMRLATMVTNPFLQEKREYLPEKHVLREYLLQKEHAHLRKLLTMRVRQARSRKTRKHIFDEEKYMLGLVHLSSEFFQFLNVVMIQYFLFMFNITSSGKYKNMKIITQGYDFVIPKRSKSPHTGIYKLWNSIINSASGNGKWLNVPLNIRGIANEKTQEAVMYIIIYEFNEMLIQLAEYKLFTNTFHIDCRGIANYAVGDWFDELHLRSKAFGKVSSLYKDCISSGKIGGEKKVFYEDLK